MEENEKKLKELNSFKQMYSVSKILSNFNSKNKDTSELKIQQVLNQLGVNTWLFLKNENFSSTSAIVTAHPKKKNIGWVPLNKLVSIFMDVLGRIVFFFTKKVNMENCFHSGDQTQ